MKTTTRKFLSVLLTLLMMAGVIAVAPITASAAPAVGSKVTFGTYPQSWYIPESDPANPVVGNVYTDADGTKFMYMGNSFKIEPIEWRVLASDGGKLLLLSEKILDRQTFHPTQIKMTWENCGMRVFLNGNFITRAFSAAEQAAIQTTTVETPNNEQERTYGGSDTNDKIFLLSVEEVNEYAAINRSAAGTSFAFINTTGEDGDKYHWWLRSPGANIWPDTNDPPDWDNSYGAASVGADGVVFGRGNWVDISQGVRPALWVNANALSAPHTHTWSADWKRDATGHWKDCGCGEKSSFAAHTPGNWTVDTPATATMAGSRHRTCSVCGYVETQAIPATGVNPPAPPFWDAWPGWLVSILRYVLFGWLWMSWF